MNKYSESSLSRLETCHPKLQTLFKFVLPECDHTILCGHRGKEDQEKAVAEGKSQVHFPNSKHNLEPSRAVDVAPSPIEWDNEERFKDFAKIVFKNAECLGIKVVWGGNWLYFKDLPHWELHAEEA